MTVPEAKAVRWRQRRDGRVLALEDRFGSIDVWILPTRIVAMRWPSRRVGGRVISWTLGEPVASTFLFDGVRTGVRP